jgi:hypothetical protein
MAVRNSYTDPSKLGFLVTPVVEPVDIKEIHIRLLLVLAIVLGIVLVIVAVAISDLLANITGPRSFAPPDPLVKVRLEVLLVDRVPGLPPQAQTNQREWLAFLVTVIQWPWQPDGIW